MDRYAERNPGLMDQSDAAIAREMLKMVRKSIKECEG
jgi:cytochrome c-type biogenesis protein CcmH/NrfF